MAAQLLPLVLVAPCVVEESESDSIQDCLYFFSVWAPGLSWAVVSVNETSNRNSLRFYGVFQVASAARLLCRSV